MGGGLLVVLVPVLGALRWSGLEGKGVILKILFTWWKYIVRSGNSYIFSDYLIALLLTFFGQELVFFAGQE